MKRILQLSTYPITKPLHGGQIRVSEIRKFFESNDCVVKSLSLSEMSHGYYNNENDFLLNDNELKKFVDIPFCTDVATSLLSTQGKAFDFLKTNIFAFKPDIILIEQVWLWPAVKRLENENFFKKDIKIIYSSQNIEFQVKKSLLISHGITGENVDKIITDIYTLEKDLCENAQMVIACTDIDATEFHQIGAQKTIVCNNGVSRRKVNSAISKQLKTDLSTRKYILFVGSAYPPNALGFWEMLGGSLAWLPPECVLIAAGGVSQILENYMPEHAKLYSYVSMDRIKKLGFVSTDLLASLLDNASVIILPITIGGGSNLKTAEAIASGLPVVATKTACRGFDLTKNLTNFVIADGQSEFIEAVLFFLNNVNVKKISSAERLDRKNVYWENTLQSLHELWR